MKDWLDTHGPFLPNPGWAKGTAHFSIDGLELATAQSPFGGVSSLDLGRLFTRAALFLSNPNTPMYDCRGSATWRVVWTSR
jgi:hypothetical protein